MTRHKSLITSLLGAICLMLCATACTSNDGDIGPLFGNWKAVDIAFENTPDTRGDGQIYWSFQNTTVSMRYVTDHNTAIATYGNWRLEDDTLFLDFPDEHLFYWTDDFLIPRHCELQVIKFTSGQLVVAYHPTTDSSITFTFKKY